MKKLNVNLNYKVRYKEGELKVSNQQITYNYILGSVNSKYEKGVEGSYRRMLARIFNKLDDAIDKNLDIIELEESELDLIKNALRDGKLPATMAYNAILLEDEIDKALKE